MLLVHVRKRVIIMPLFLRGELHKQVLKISRRAHWGTGGACRVSILLCVAWMRAHRVNTCAHAGLQS